MKPSLSVGRLSSWRPPLTMRSTIERSKALLRRSIELDGDDRIVDVHLWSVAPGVRAACVSLVSVDPREPSDCKARIPPGLRVKLMTLELHRCEGAHPRQGLAQSDGGDRGFRLVSTAAFGGSGSLGAKRHQARRQWVPSHNTQVRHARLLTKPGHLYILSNVQPW